MDINQQSALATHRYNPSASLGENHPLDIANVRYLIEDHLPVEWCRLDGWVGAYSQTGNETRAIGMLVSFLADPKPKRHSWQKNPRSGTPLGSCSTSWEDRSMRTSFAKARTRGAEVSVQVGAKQLLAES